MERITVPEDKFALFVELRSFRKAVEVAAKMRDPYKLQEVGRICKDQALERQIQDLLMKM